MEKNQILKTKFLSLSNWEEMMDLFEHYFTEYKQEKKSPINKKALANLLFRKETFKYKSYTIKKKNGEERLIHAPIPDLKLIQQVLNECIQLCFTPRNAAHGFIKERSIVTNAKMHVKRKFVYNVDLENFFPSIHFGRVIGVFKSHPFDFNADLARIVANLCCFRHVLPQGAPTSPVISNLVCRWLDRHLSSFAKKHRVRYSRYADDITFSSNIDVFTEQFKTELESIINQENFKVNKTKERLQTQKERQTVTGIIVNQKLNVTKKYKRDLRFLIKLLEKEKEQDTPKFSAQSWLDANYKNRQRYFGNVPKIEEVIRGKLDFMKMVVGEERPLFQKLSAKYEALIGEYEEEPHIITEKIAKIESIIMSIASKRKPNKIAEDLIKLKIVLSTLNKNKAFKAILEKAEAIFKEKSHDSNNPLLIASLKKEKIDNPFDSIDQKFTKHTNAKDKTGYSSPQNIVELLRQFHNGDNPFGQLLHSSPTPFIEVAEAALAEFRKIKKINDEQGISIPTAIYFNLGELIGTVNTKGFKERYSNKEHKLFYGNEEKLITGFKKSFRFGNNDENIKISEIIKYHLLITSKKSSPIWYFDIEEGIDELFRNVLTSTQKVFNAIGKIVESCENYSSIGAVKFLAIKRNNKIILKIINIGTDARQRTPYEYISNDMGGDIEIIRQQLKGYCDFSIVTTFNDNQHNKIQVLPPTDKTVSNTEDTPEGFTYELKFYRPLKILLIDNGDSEKRILKAKDILIKKPIFKNILNCSVGLSDYSLKNYNAVFIHASNPEYGDVRESLIKYQTPFITFGGGENYNNYGFNISMNDEMLYRNLSGFLSDIYNKKKIDFEFFDKLFESKTNVDEKEILALANRIKEKAIDPRNLPEEIKNELHKLVGGQVELPKFETVRQIINFAETHTQ